MTTHVTYYRQWFRILEHQHLSAKIALHFMKLTTHPSTVRNTVAIKLHSNYDGRISYMTFGDLSLLG